MAIIFIFMVLIAWILYLRRERVYTMVIFLFFLTSGFQLIPEEVMFLMTGFSKGSDYAIVLICGCIAINFIFSKGRYLKSDEFTFWMWFFLGFIFVCMIYSVSNVGCSIKETIQASRQFFLILAYLVFRNMTKEELQRLLMIIIYVTLLDSCLYILQAVLSTDILTGAYSSEYRIGDFVISRYYNQPMALYFCAFLVIYANLLRGGIRLLAIGVFFTAIVLGFNRSGIGIFFVALFIGYVMRLPKVRQVRFVMLSVAIMVPAIVLWGHNFTKSKTYGDIQALVDGRYSDANIDIYMMQNSTFAYRIGHLLERINYIEENPETRFFGVGLMPEESPLVSRFGFFLGLSNERGDVAQLESPDISYSYLFLRFGYLGSAIYLAIFIFMAVFFFRRKQSDYAVSAFLFIIFSLGISFFSSNLSSPLSFVLPLIILGFVKKEIPSGTSSVLELEQKQLG